MTTRPSPAWGSFSWRRATADARSEPGGDPMHVVLGRLSFACLVLVASAGCGAFASVGDAACGDRPCRFPVDVDPAAAAVPDPTGDDLSRPSSPATGPDGEPPALDEPGDEGSIDDDDDGVLDDAGDEGATDDGVLDDAGDEGAGDDDGFDDAGDDDGLDDAGDEGSNDDDGLDDAGDDGPNGDDGFDDAGDEGSNDDDGLDEAGEEGPTPEAPGERLGPEGRLLRSLLPSACDGRTYTGRLLYRWGQLWDVDRDRAVSDEDARCIDGDLYLDHAFYSDGSEVDSVLGLVAVTGAIRVDGLDTVGFPHLEVAGEIRVELEPRYWLGGYAGFAALTSVERLRISGAKSLSLPQLRRIGERAAFSELHWTLEEVSLPRLEFVGVGDGSFVVERAPGLERLEAPVATAIFGTLRLQDLPELRRLRFTELVVLADVDVHDVPALPVEDLAELERLANASSD